MYGFNLTGRPESARCSHRINWTIFPPRDSSLQETHPGQKHHSSIVRFLCAAERGLSLNRIDALWRAEYSQQERAIECGQLNIEN